jgi:hypothetical protein
MVGICISCVEQQEREYLITPPPPTQITTILNVFIIEERKCNWRELGTDMRKENKRAFPLLVIFGREDYSHGYYSKVVSLVNA